jgi:hypothetical protein
LPSLINEAIKILCSNTNDGANFNFQGVPVSPSTISSLISKMDECITALSTAGNALNTFCTTDSVIIYDLKDVNYLNNTIDKLLGVLNDTISQLRNLH